MFGHYYDECVEGCPICAEEKKAAQDERRRKLIELQKMLRSKGLNSIETSMVVSWVDRKF